VILAQLSPGLKLVRRNERGHSGVIRASLITRVQRATLRFVKASNSCTVSSAASNPHDKDNNAAAKAALQRALAW
jgi:hypothetical protein